MQKNRLKKLLSWYTGGGENLLIDLPTLPLEQVFSYRALYHQPGKIIGGGMNYLAKAIEMSGRPPEDEPVIFPSRTHR